MTTEASKSDHLTAALAKLTHDLEALPGKIAAQVAAEVAALKKAPLPTLLVGGKNIPFLVLNVDMGADDDFEGHFTVASEHADLLRVSSTIEIRSNGKLMCRAGRLLSTRREGGTIVCAASSVTADPPLWERHKDAHGQLQPLETLPFIEKMTQAD